MRVNTIYLIECVKNGKKYVGQTWQSINERWTKHKSDARTGKGWHLAKAIRKYGSDSFRVEKLAEIFSQEEANFLESYYISLFDTIKLGYNITGGGQGARRLGIPLSEATKKKISKANSGSNNGMYGKHRSEEHKNKLATIYKGEGAPSAKLTEIQVLEIKLIMEQGKVSNRKIAKLYNVSSVAIDSIKKGFTWSNITGHSRQPPTTTVKLTTDKVKEIKLLIHLGDLSNRKIAKMYNVSSSCIDDIKIGKTWINVIVPGVPQ